jgi:CheY-like chemotaxis protein
MDDEPAIRRLAVVMLEDSGYEVEVADDGARAVARYAAAAASGRPFDAVILDLTVPGGMGGREALRLLREQDPGVRAIVSSGFSTDPVMSQYGEYGFLGVVTKPYLPAELLRTLASVLGARPAGPSG